MDHHHYRRNVRTAANERQPGAADIGKVGRVLSNQTRDPTPGRRGRRRRTGGRPGDEKKAAAHRKLAAGWSLALFGMALVVLSVACVVWLMPKLKERGGGAGQVERVPPEIHAPLRPDSPDEEQLMAATSLVLDESDPGRIGNLVRLGESSGLEVVAFFKEVKRTEGTNPVFEYLGGMDANGLPLEGVLVNYRKDGVPRNRLALFTPDEGGEWKMDFAAFARLSVPPFSVFTEGEEQEIVARVHVSRDNYYNGVFRNDREWVCYGVASSDHPELLMGYCRVGSPQAAAMARLARDARKAVRVTLKLRRVEGAERRQLHIERVLAEDWVMGAAPFDQRFGG